MHTHTINLLGAAPGVRHSLTVLQFGSGAGPKATIQAALHADEVPALLVAQVLRQRLLTLEAEGALRGTVQLVPYANPLGLAQHLLGTHLGRFDLRDGLNFNRGHAELAAAVQARVEGRMGDDPAANVARVRAALREAAAALPAETPGQDLKRRLVQTAIDSDIVLDLHADGEAAMHLYALTPQADLAGELGALLGARAVLLATESGDSPFDEACSRPWLLLQQALAPAPLPLACFSATVELRGEADTSHALAAQDAEALLQFLQRRGVIEGLPPALPVPRCEPTPLAGSEPLSAPVAGVVVFHAAVGDMVTPGTLVADVVDVESGALHPVVARSAGVLYARSGTRWATPGKRLGKVAGVTLARTGRLLSP
ncbi:MAG: succinylglutamate desuccinylase/aspartoacylase family protein [Rubrivivax sp.]|nr:succinylglutamate desuccinylase/aspartoacylase family protein [Rubrivivax sp.]